MGIILLLLFLQAVPSSGTTAPADAAKEFQSAVEQLRRGRPEVAEPILERLSRKYPNEASVQQALGMVYAMKHQPQRAMPYLEKAVRLKPSGEGYAALGATYFDLGRDDHAIGALKKALALDPAHLGANFNLGSLYMKREAYAQALPYLERVVRARPQVPESAYMLGICYSALGRPGETRRVLMALPAKARDQEQIQLLLGSAALSINQREEAQKNFERALQLNSDSVQAGANLGALLVARGSPKEGRRVLENAWKKDPSSYLAGYNLALAYRTEGNYEAARSVLATLLTKGETAEIYDLLGDVESKLQDHQSAIEHFERAVKLDPNEANLFDLGYELLQQWKLEGAVSAFRRGTEQFPQSGRMWMGLGSAYFAEARNEEAVSAYLRAAELAEDPRAYRFLGTAYLAANLRRPDVDTRFHRYRQNRPQDAWANFYDGYCQARSGETEQALPLLRRAVELDPNLAEAYFELGNIDSTQGRQQEALASYEAAVKTNPQYQEAWYRLGQSYARAGRQAEADRAFGRHEELRKQQAADMEARRRQIIQSLYRKPEKQDHP